MATSLRFGPGALSETHASVERFSEDGTQLVTRDTPLYGRRRLSELQTCSLEVSNNTDQNIAAEPPTRVFQRSLVFPHRDQDGTTVKTCCP